MAETSLSALYNTWYWLGGRSVTVTKQSANTDIWVTYDDTLTWRMTCHGDAGDFRLVIDSSVYRNPNRVYSQVHLHTI
jgi:hypothetical protein